MFFMQNQVYNKLKLLLVTNKNRFLVLDNFAKLFLETVRFFTSICVKIYIAVHYKTGLF